MDPFFLKKLDAWRGTLPSLSFVLTTPAYSTKGHSENSYHYRGQAVDGRLIEKATGRVLSAFEHFVIAMKSPFGGIGLYTWSKRGPFIHLDYRPYFAERKIWVCLKQGVYENLSENFIRSLSSDRSDS